MKTPSFSNKSESPKMNNEKRRKALKKNLILGVPVLLISALFLAFLFYLIYTIHTADNLTLNTDTGLVVQDGDSISIDFVGTVKDEEYQGDSLTGKNEYVSIGSGDFIGDFEEQLIGHHVGETVDVTITYPEDYADDSLREKEVTFAATINGIYQ